jgi:septation ring formation regulator EzrA
MAEITNALIDEVPKAVRADVAQVEERLTSIEQTRSAMRSHLAGLVTSELTREADLAALRARIERIERRPELQVWGTPPARAVLLT